MLIYQLLSALLEYPDQELKDCLAEIETALDDDPDVSDAEGQAIRQFLAWMGETGLTPLQAAYVQTFDLTPENSLHLTHHLFGEEKGRGPALIDLSEYYKSYGVEVQGNELPDFLPLMLEFSSRLSDAEARVFLGDAAKVLNVLAANLERAGSPYAPLVRIIENRGRLTRLAA